MKIKTANGMCRFRIGNRCKNLDTILCKPIDKDKKGFIKCNHFNPMINKDSLNWWCNLKDKERFKIIEVAYNEYRKRKDRTVRN